MNGISNFLEHLKTHSLPDICCPDIEYLTTEELIILYEFIEYMHIPYDNVKLLEVVRKLARIVNDN